MVCHHYSFYRNVITLRSGLCYSRLLGVHTLASFLHAVILGRVYEWSGSGTNTWLRTRLTRTQDVLCSSSSNAGAVAKHAGTADAWTQVIRDSEGAEVIETYKLQC